MTYNRTYMQENPDIGKYIGIGFVWTRNNDEKQVAFLVRDPIPLTVFKNQDFLDQLKEKLDKFIENKVDIEWVYEDIPINIGKGYVSNPEVILISMCDKWGYGDRLDKKDIKIDFESVRANNTSFYNEFMEIIREFGSKVSGEEMKVISPFKPVEFNE